MNRSSTCAISTYIIIEVCEFDLCPWAMAMRTTFLCDTIELVVEHHYHKRDMYSWIEYRCFPVSGIFKIKSK